MITDIQQRILELKRDTGTAVLAHSYQAREIVEIADFTGDSYALSEKAKPLSAPRVILAGVRFMAETVKLLSPGKRVFLANTDASCPMAEQLDPELLSAMKERDPERKVVAYVNTTAALKALSDVCVTSSSAVRIVSRMLERNPREKILFIPDCNLGAFVQAHCPGADIKLVQGGCPVHAAVTSADFHRAKAAHPDALVLTHPECMPDVVALSDYAGSTAGIMDYARNSSAREFIIGTEMSIAEHLQYELPEKRFYILSKKILCPNMKLTTLPDILNLLEDISAGKAPRNEINIPEEVAFKAVRCLEEMIK